MARVLMMSTLFPSSAQPNHGVFVETRLRETLKLGGLNATALAPVPYFPSTHPVFGRYADFARAPRHEVRHGLDVWHPRYLAVPGLAERFGPGLLYRAALAQVRRLAARGQGFDVIDAHYLYPDGVAAVRLGRALRLPVVVTARGSDVTQLSQSAGPRARMARAVREASATVAVCEDLRRRVLALGAPPERVLTLRNGVDLARFAPGDRSAARGSLSLTGFTLASVGALIERKDHALILRALAALPDVTLLLAGSGPLRGALQELARRLGVADRVRFLGEVPQAELPRLYRAADASVLASSREGWANVLLESMACGTPVVASDVNGSAEAVRAPAAGRLLRERTPACLAATVTSLRRDMPTRGATRAYAEQFGWETVARANRALLLAAAQAGYGGRRGSPMMDGGRLHLAQAGGGPIVGRRASDGSSRTARA